MEDLSALVENSIENVETVDLNDEVVSSSSILKEYEAEDDKIAEYESLIFSLKEEYKDVFDKIALYQSEISKIQDNQGEIKKKLCVQMEKENIKDLSDRRYKVTYYSPSVAHKLMDTFKVDYPDLYDKYTTKTNKSSYVKLSVVKEK